VQSPGRKLHPKTVTKENLVSYPALQELIGNYSTPFLLEQYVHMRDQYTEDAVRLMQDELVRRKIGEEEIEEFRKKSLIGAEGERSNVQVRHFKRDDFVKLDGVFNRADGYLVRAMFGEENVPFFVDTNIQFNAIPGQENAQRVGVFVHNDSKDKALALIENHFELADGVYRVKHSDVKDRLISFSFQEIQHPEIDSADITGVHFSREEKDVLTGYGTRLIAEIDDIEGRDGRIVFHFDNVEGLLERLADSEPELTASDLLTALEILQIYCRDEGFGPTAEGIAQALLAFFLQ
jgi:hypothetical protein